MTKRHLSTLMFAGLASLWAGFAQAYTTFTCGSGDAKWSSETRTLYAHTGSFPSGSAFRSALNEAVSRLNQNAAGFRFNVVYTSTNPSMGNGRSEIWIDNINPPGVTNVWWNGSCNLTEADIRMDSSVTWTTSTNKTTHSSYQQSGGARPFQTTMLHELGHALGLGHEADEYNIMGQDWDHIHTNGISARSYFGEDASDGAVDLYGPGSTQDLGVVHWRRTGASGEYSRHDRTRLLNPSTNAELSYTINAYGERKYNVVRGQNVRVELSFENNGNSYQYQDVGYYVSTNDYISTLDTLLKTRNMGLSPDSVLTSSYTVTIPSNLSCNKDYWVGAVIDKDGSLPENIGFNNASYIPIRVNWSLACWQIVYPTPPIGPILPRRGL